MKAFINTNASIWLDTLTTCGVESIAAGVAKVIGEQMIRSFVDTAALMTPKGWVGVAVDAVNEAVPVFTSYLSPGAGSAEYFIDWQTDAAGNPYIARVSETPPDDKEPSTPDLVVERPSVSVNPLTTGQAFTLSATVHNQGTNASPGTTLRYYRSSDAIITRQDTQLDTDWISGMNPSSSRSASTNLTAPSTAGVYYYGACVDSVAGEANTGNNCSSEVRVTVGVQAKPTITSVSNASATEGRSLTFTVRLSKSTTQTETYYYSTYSGGRTPSEQGDYTGADEQAVQVPSGISSFTIQISTNQDADSDDETFYLYVTEERNHPFSAPGPSRYRGTGTIEEPPPTQPSISKMYWHTVGTIQRANLDGSQRETLVSGLNVLNDIALDVAGSKMYWIQSGSAIRAAIQRANLDGSQRETLVSGVFAANSLVLDVARGKMYWTEDRSIIQRANLDGSQRETLVLISTEESLGNLVLDVARGKMYWADTTRLSEGPVHTIRRANLDGSQRETLVSEGLLSLSVRDIALDVAGGKMYWTELNAIRRANLDGSQREKLVSGWLWVDVNELALDVARGKMYWTEYDTIKRANLDGSQRETLVSGVYAYDLVLAVTSTSRRSAITSQRSERFTR